MKYIKYGFIFLILMSDSLLADGNAGVIELDLAKMDEDVLNEKTIEIKDINNFTIRLINALPSMKYHVRIGDQVERLSPLDLKINTDPKGCAELYEAEKFNLFYEIDEKIIRLIKQKYKDDLEQFCEDSELRMKYLDSINLITTRNSFLSGFELKKADIIDINVLREASKSDEKEHKWQINIVADGNYDNFDNNGENNASVNDESSDGNSASKNKDDDSGQWYEIDNWSISYGFAFPIMFSNDEYYYVREIDSIPDKFEIKKRRDNQYLKFIPSIFLHWNPNYAEESEWSYSVSGGLGFDMENPIIFGGGSVSYHSMLNFNFGIVVHKVHKLNGKYSTGDLINDILDFEQLHEEFYRMNPFVGISFKF